MKLSLLLISGLLLSIALNLSIQYLFILLDAISNHLIIGRENNIIVIGMSVSYSGVYIFNKLYNSTKDEIHHNNHS